MEVMKKIACKSTNIHEADPITIAFLGDSITQGCFEMVETPDGKFRGVCDQEYGYQNKVKKILMELFPSVPVTTVNAGIGGGGAPHGYERLERDVLRFNPDLVVVCFGLNDCMAGIDCLDEYIGALKGIFSKLQSAGIESIFMTPNMMATEAGGFFSAPELQKTAEEISKVQNNGVLELFLLSACDLCKNMNVPVCDCYDVWKRMNKCGVNTNRLLANHLNHPTRNMHWLFALSLVNQMLTD